MRGGNHAKQSDIDEEEIRPTCSVNFDYFISTRVQKHSTNRNTLKSQQQANSKENNPRYRNQQYLFSILGIYLGQSWLKSWLRLNSQLPPFTEYIMMPCNKKLKSLSHNKLTRHKESADLINDMGNRKGLELLA